MIAEVIVYFYAPLLSFFLLKHMSDNEDDNEFVKVNIAKEILTVLLFFAADNIIILAILSAIKGTMNISEAFSSFSRFSILFFIMSSCVGTTTAVVYKKFLLGKEFAVSINRITNDEIIKKTIEGIAVAVGIIGILITLFQCVDNDFWGDEAYSILYVNNAASFYDVVHSDPSMPPLYFLILKLLVMGLGEKPFVYHFSSAIPTIILLLFSIVIVRKRFGCYSSILFSLMMIMTDTGRKFAVEVRPYEWAALFCVFCLYAGLNLIETQGKKVKYWIVFCISGVCAAYTHYFAFAGVILIYFFVFLKLCFLDRKNIYRSVVTIVLSLVLYLPWIGRFFLSVNEKVEGSFWITGTVSIREGFDYIFSYDSILYVFSILLMLGIIFETGFLMISYSVDRPRIKISFFNNSEKTGIVYICVTTTISTIIIFLFAIVFGKLVRPVFTHRYIYPMAVCLWFAFAIIPSFIKKHEILVVTYVALIVLVIHVFGPTFWTGLTSYHDANTQSMQCLNVIDECIDDPKNTVLLTDVSHFYWTVLRYYYPECEVDYASPDTDYKDYFKDSDDVLLLLETQLDDKQIKQWEEALGKDIEYVFGGMLATDYFYLYDVD